MDTQPSTAPTAGQVFISKDASARIQVVKVEPDSISFARKGGGFVMKMTTETFHSRFDPETQEPPLTTALFAFDGVTTLILGYTVKGDLWNGWAKPMFTKEGAQLIAQSLPGMTYKEETDSFDIDLEGEMYSFCATTVQIPIMGAVKVYAIGAGSWCWNSWYPDEDLTGYTVVTVPEFIYT